MKIFSDESFIMENGMGLLRFWQIFIKNHAVYFNYRRQFMTQMINSMQYIMMQPNPISSNVINKKIAWDLSFLYIEWKFRELREELTQFAPIRARERLIKQFQQ